MYKRQEYTKSNIEFALSVDPQNVKLKTRRIRTLDSIAKGIPTVPSTLEEELETNPFLRESEASILDNIDTVQSDPVSRFAKIRALKDNF